MFGIFNTKTSGFAHLPLAALLNLLERDGITPPKEARAKMENSQMGEYFHIHHFTIFRSKGGITLD